MDSKTVKKYFEENAEAWVLDGYESDGYNYPVAWHRRRVVLKELSKSGRLLCVLDLGSGGGELACLLASENHQVIGVDQSKEMIKLANEERSLLAYSDRQRIQFVHKQIEKYKSRNSFDAVTAMGLIGYLDRDETLFRIATKFLKKEGLFLVSCRNRLFNMTSISHRTLKEIEFGNAPALISEIERLYDVIPKGSAAAFIENLKSIFYSISDILNTRPQYKMSPSEKKEIGYTMTIEARQHTPEGLNKVAESEGFQPVACYGVHPHLMIPRLNELLPPQLFNKLSDCLLPLEHLPISLAWSSVFVSVFKKL